MREGIYTIDSIESGLVKLLYANDETIEEIVKKDQFAHQIQQGDVIEIKVENGVWHSIPLEKETKNRKEKARVLMEKLKNKYN